MFRRLRVPLTAWLRRSRFERDMADEVHAHLALRVDALMATGLSREEAERRARLEFGAVEGYKDRCRDARQLGWIDDARQDVRYAVRTLAGNPGFTLVAVLTLALGIGATTAIFSLTRAVLLEPLPYPDASRLVRVWEDGSRTGLPAEIEASPANFFDWQDQNVAFEGMSAWDFGDVSLTGTGDPVRLRGYRVSSELFDVLGVPPSLGRTFARNEEEPGQAAVVILGHALWQSRFGGSPAVVGQVIPLDDQPHTVIGVMPQGFDFPARGTEIWTPLAMSPELRRNRSAYNLNVLARLRPDVSQARAQEEMDALARRLTENAPENFRFGARVTSLRDRLVGDTGTAVLLLLAIAASVLLIAAANLANLVLARALTRRQDVALRAALGAGRGRVVRQLLTEHLIPSAAGAALGLVVARLAASSLSRLVPQNMTAARLELDVGVLLVAAALCIATTLGLGALPCRLAWRVRLGDVLRSADSRASETRGAQRVRSMLLVAQTAFAVLLLIAAGLMVQTYLRLATVDPGFRGERVLTLRTDLPVPRYADPVRRTGFYRDVLERVHAMPGVSSAGFTTFLPFVFSGGARIVEIEGQPEPQVDPAVVRLVTPGYVPAMGMTLVEGRLLHDSDREDTEPVVVINETMAQRFWPAGDALGKRFRPAGCAEVGLTGPCPWQRVVGIVGDVHQDRLRTDVRPEYSMPFAQFPPADLIPFMAPKDLAVRTAGDPQLLIEAVRQAVWAVDPQQPIAQVRVMAEYVDEDLAPDRLQAQLVGTFAGLALLLASLGVYGVLSYTITQRHREVSLRKALGAQTSDLVGWVVGRGLRPVVVGLVIGVAAAYGLAHLIGSLLYDVQPRDPLVFGVATGVLAAVALLAAWLPARRIARVDPFNALRCD